MLEVSQLLAVATGKRTEGACHARYAPSTGPAMVVWNVCRQCNLTCPHCYASASLRPQTGGLTTEEGLRLLDEIASLGAKTVIFSGGEPLLRPDIYELLERAARLRLSPALSTNGVLIGEDAARRLASVGVKYVGVSIDGLPPFNDRYRGLDGAFERACAGIAASKAAGLKTGVRMTLTRHNRDQVEPLHAEARRLGVDRFYVSHLVYSGRGRRMAGHDLDTAACRSTLERLFEIAERLVVEGGGPDLVTGGNDSDGPFLVSWVARRHGFEKAAALRALLARRGGNSAGEKLIAIDWLGRVHPDQFWQGAVLGDVREKPLREILEHPLVAALRDREARLSGRCGACSFRPLCRGSHRERAIAVHGDPWAPDPACVLTDVEIGAEPVLGAVVPSAFAAGGVA